MGKVLCILVWLAIAAPGEAQTLNARERSAVIAGAAELIETRYVHPAEGRAIARALRRNGRALEQTDPQAFAAALTLLLRQLSQDGHFAVEYRAAVAADTGQTEADHAAAEAERYYGVGVNHGFEAVRRLEGGVGYLDLRVFAPPEWGADLAEAAMAFLAQSPALIIDLRRNGGGHGDMALLLAAYLFDEPVEMSGTYDRPSDVLTRAFTPPVSPRRRFGENKPVYILISRRTFSAAEGFAYDVQARGRAIVVGEPSGGGAHPFEYRAINECFILSLPEGRSVNPITNSDWQGTGVEPDVHVSADDALDVALRLALQAVAQREDRAG
ncbi:MAG: S41 family peptidase [Hyphomonadaceae bacterium]|nr:S41 family peptidase [Hyphomonadaceae bacterium]